MKSLVFLFGISLFLFACTEETPAPQFDSDKRQLEVIDSAVNALFGVWKISTMSVDADKAPWLFYKTNITKDTVIENFASLEVYAVTYQSSPVSRKSPTMLGTLIFDGQRIPVAFNLWPAAERTVKGVGPHCFTHLGTNYGPGVRTTTKNEDYLRSLGLLDDNFSIEITANDKLIWRGLSRNVEKMELVKTALFAPIGGQ